MGQVISTMSMSLDGFVADPDDGVDELFDWYQNGPVTVPTAGDRWEFHVSAASAVHLRAGMEGAGALICGRGLFDHTGGWGGLHPVGCPVFVMTHEPPTDWPATDPPFTFVSEGVERAVQLARAAAGDRNVAIASPDIVRQCLDARLLDAIVVDLVPVLMGSGIRYFDRLTELPVRLGDPAVVQGTGVTHLTYAVTYDR